MPSAAWPWRDSRAALVARMRILFDHGTPVPLRRMLSGHHITTAYEMGWAALDNGSLLAAAETRFDAFVTTDQNLRYQQNRAGRRLAILVLPTTNWPLLEAHIAELLAALATLRSGELVELKLSS